MVDDVRFKIGADTRGLDTALRNSRRSVDRDVNGIGTGFTRMDRDVTGALDRSTRSLNTFRVAAVAAAGVGLVLLARRLADAVTEAAGFAAAIRDVSERVGVGTESLQELRFAAEQSGSSIEAMDKGLEQLGRRMGEAAAGTGTLVPILEEYGIALTDAEGRTRSVDAVLADVADAMKNAGSASERLRIANAAFGRSGVELVNTLQDGSEGLREQADAARELGAVMSDELVQAGGEADDRLAALGRTLETQLTSALINLAPVIETVGGWLVWLTGLANRAIELISNMDVLTDSDVLPRAMSGSSTDLGNLLRIQRENEELRRAWVEERTTQFSRDPAEFNRITEQIRILDEIMADTAAQIEAVRAGGEGTWRGNLTQPLTAEIPPPPPPPGSTGGSGGGSSRPAAVREERDAYADLVAKMQERIEALGIEEDVLGMTEEAAIRYKLVQEALLQLARDGVAVTPEQRAEIEALAQSFAAGEESIRDFNEAQEEAAQRAQELDQLLTDVGQAAVDAFADAVESGEGFDQILRTLIANLLRLESVQAAVGSIFADAFDGGGFNFGNLFGAGASSAAGNITGSGWLTNPRATRAEGGDVMAGRPYIVGERRPEIFVPDQSGVILPNAAAAMGGGGRGGGTYYIDATGADAAGLARLETVIRAMNGSIEKRAVGAVVDARRRNPGLFA